MLKQFVGVDDVDLDLGVDHFDVACFIDDDVDFLNDFFNNHVGGRRIYCVV